MANKSSLKQSVKTLRIDTSEKNTEKEMIIDEAMSPTAQALQRPQLLNCCIVAVMGSKTCLDVNAIKKGLENTLIKHPRFSSFPVENGADKVWRRTKVNVNDHVICPEIDVNMESSGDEFVEEYVAKLTTTLMDFTKPLWEMHLLNIKTSDANAVIVFRIHHSIGDGVSLINLLLASTRKSSDPEALPTLPMCKQLGGTNSDSRLRFLIWRNLLNIWTLFLMVLHTVVDVILSIATATTYKDTTTPIKGEAGVELTPKRIIHNIIALHDIKLVKNTMNLTVNDVLVGITEAGLSRYLNGRYAKNKDRAEDQEIGSMEMDNLPKDIRLRAILMVNVRPSAKIEDFAAMMKEEECSNVKLGTRVGNIVLPFNIRLRQNPLDYIHQSKAILDRKKLSFESMCSHYLAALSQKSLGVKRSSSTLYNIFSNTTFTFSNVVGPQEAITLFGHPLAYVAPSVYGLPHAMVLHWQSYCDKMIMSLSVDPNVIPDPHKLASDIELSLKLIKGAAMERAS